jgi:HEXXH motif-containing protein
MPDHVRALLDARASADSDRLRFVRLGLVGELVTASSCDRNLARALTVAIAVVGELRGEVVVADFTPFAWKALRQVTGALDAPRDELELRISRALALLIDSIARITSAEQRLWLHQPAGEEVALPAMQRIVPATPQARWLESRLAGGTIEVRDAGGTRIDQPLPVLPILGSPGTFLVLSAAATMFDSPYRQSLAPDTRHAAELAAMLSTCLDRIERSDPDTGGRLRRQIRWFFPLQTLDRMTHNSFTVKGMSGVMFVSEAYEELRLAEAMVHEFQHGELYRLQETTQLWTTSDDARFYSPWRPDARPVEGLFHAIHVFTAVARFLHAAAIDETLPELRVRMALRRLEVIRQVRLGIAQLPHAELTATGRTIINAIDADVRDHEAELGPACGLVPDVMVEHWRRWCTAHPTLATRLVLPAAFERQ